MFLFFFILILIVSIVHGLSPDYYFSDGTPKRTRAPTPPTTSRPTASGEYLILWRSNWLVDGRWPHGDLSLITNKCNVESQWRDVYQLEPAKPFLSYAGFNVRDLNVSQSLPVMGNQGIQIAANFSSLFIGNLTNSLSTANEYPSQWDKRYFWTGSFSNGTYSGNACSGWNSILGFGTVGLTDEKMGWLNNGTVPCSETMDYYCIARGRVFYTVVTTAVPSTPLIMPAKHTDVTSAAAVSSSLSFILTLIAIIIIT